MHLGFHEVWGLPEVSALDLRCEFTISDLRFMVGGMPRRAIPVLEPRRGGGIVVVVVVVIVVVVVVMNNEYLFDLCAHCPYK